MNKDTINQSYIKEAFKDFGENTSVHGVGHCTRATQFFSRFFWILIITASTGFCIFLMVMTIQDYLKYEVITVVRIDKETTSEFPMITICNKNKFLTEKSLSLVKSTFRNLTSNDFDSIFNDNSTSFHHLLYRYERFRSIMQAASSDYINDDLLAYSLDEMMIECRFNTAICEPSDFAIIKSKTHGICYQFNSKLTVNEPKHITSANSDNGLKLQLFVGHFNDMSSLSFDSGLEIYIENFNHRPMRSEPLSIPCGMNSIIDVSRLIVSKQEYPHSSCRLEQTNAEYYNKSIIYREMVKKNLSYNEEDCLLYCFQYHIIRSCNCSLHTIDTLFDIEPCETDSQLMCREKHKIEYNSKNLIKSYKHLCPDQCNSIEYSNSIGMSTYPTVAYQKLLQKLALFNNKNNSQDIKIDENGFIALSVFYKRLEFTSITEIPKMNIYTLISNLGGTLSLFIGISFLSFAEFIQLLFVLIKIIFKKR
jgi:hypothetical protein